MNQSQPDGRPAAIKFSDQEWLNMHLDAVKGTAPLTKYIPPLPPADFVRRFNGQSVEGALRHGAKFVRQIKSAASLCGQPLHTAKFLDFGCGWGRHIRLLLNEVPPSNLYGSDVNRDAVALCQRDIAGVSFGLNHARPPLSYPRNEFDLVYAQSVFSHLSEHLHIEWLTELHRVLKVGGILLVTTYGPNKLVEKRPALGHIYRNFGYVFYPTPGGPFKGWGETVISEDYVRRVWCDLFDVLDYSFSLEVYPQAVIRCRKR